MIKVECPGCKAPYQVDERRVPDAGLKMRCPKCATSFVVMKPGSAPAARKSVAPPDAGAAPAQKAAAAPLPAQKAPALEPLRGGAKDAAPDSSDWDLPAFAPRAAPAGAPPPAQKRPAPAAPAAADPFDDAPDLPIVAAGGPGPRGEWSRAKTAPAGPSALNKAGPRAFGEIDLLVDLPAPEAHEPELDLPIVRDGGPPRGAPPPAPRAPLTAPMPTSAATPVAKGKKNPRAVKTQLFGDTVPDPAAAPAPDSAPAAPIRVPAPAREGSFQNAPTAKMPAVRSTPPPPEPGGPPSDPMGFGDLGFGEIDLPSPASEADLPSPSVQAGLPSPAAGLPAHVAGGALPAHVAGGALPAHVAGGALPARVQAGLPAATGGTSLPSAAQGPPHAAARKSTPGVEAFESRNLTPGADSFAFEGRRPQDRSDLRKTTPDPGRVGRRSSPDLEGPAVHGPGHVAGADIYTSPAAYDQRNMDPAFQTTARAIPAPPPEADEAPLMTTSGASIGSRDSRESSPGRAGSNSKTVPEPRLARGSQPGSEPRLARSSQPNMADLIDRTSIELDLIEPTATPPPAPPPPQAEARMPRAEARIPSPLSVPDLGSPDIAPPRPRFEADPLSEPSISEGRNFTSDAGTEVPLGAIDDGGEADIDGRGHVGPRANGMPKMAAPSPTTDAPPAPRRPWRRYVVALAVAGLFGGALLALVPDIGPFGLNFVSDRVNKGMQNDALDKVRELVQADLEADISAGAERAIAKVKTGQAAYPRHRATAGYAAFVSFIRVLRFGPRAEDKAYGDKMVLEAKSKPSDFLLLGQASQDAASGQIARARQTMQGLLERRADDMDVAVLAGEIELLAKNGDQAVKVWQRAVDIKKVPRSLFGLARAQFAANDFIGAEASAKKTLEMSPKHVGARTLLAAIVWQNGGREQQALELLSKVTEDGEIRSSAGEPELVAAYTQLGQIHLAKSRMSQAEQAFAAALKIDPQAVNALVGNGELFYRSGRYTEAVARYEAATRADADSVPAKIGMAKTELFLERAKDAKDLLKKLTETRPSEPLAFYWLGRAEEMLGNKKEAEAAYTSAIKVGADSPQTVDAYVALAQLLSSLGRAEDATARLTEASNRFPGLAALHRARGEVALTTGNYEEAKKELEAALAREDDLGTKFKLGTALRRMRLFDDAAKIFDAISEADKDFPGLALERGLLFEETGQSERAFEMYAKALQSAPNDLDLKLRVGSTQVMAGHAKQAEPILREVYKAKPNSAEVNHFLGRALLVRGTSLAEAKRFLERAAEIDPNRAEYHLYVGWVANELGEMQQAENALKRAIELDRNLGDAYWQRGVLLQKQGQTIDALADLKIALEKRPSRYEAYAAMARCYEDQSKWAEAEDAWRKAIAGIDDVADWHYRLGKIFSTKGNKAGAATELDKAVTLAEAPDKPTLGWLADAHFNLAEAYRGTDREKAKHHYQRFLELAARDNPYRKDAEQALQSLGANN